MNGIAKLFMHGRSQAVRLPKEFRLPGKEVRVSRDGSKVVLEPIGRTREEVAAIWETIDALRRDAGEDLFPAGGFDDRPAHSDARKYFDE